jgi:hypothetical protein
MQYYCTNSLIHFYTCGELPGYDNEDVADEFAAMFLAQSAPKAIDQCINWLESKDSVAEAVLQLMRGDRHAISIQRARNMKKAAERSSELKKRWNRLLSPYTRKQ